MQKINNKVSSVSEQLKPNGRKPAQSKSIHSYTTDNGGRFYTVTSNYVMACPLIKEVL